MVLRRCRGEGANVVIGFGGGMDALKTRTMADLDQLAMATASVGWCVTRVRRPVSATRGGSRTFPISWPGPPRAFMRPTSFSGRRPREWA